MSRNNLKTHYSAKELLTLSLSCLPNSVQGIIYQAKKLNWTTRKRVGKGGGYEYALASLPETVQTEIRNRFTASVVQAKPQLPTVRELSLDSLTDKQRQIADARMALVQAVSQLEQTMPRSKAIAHFCEQAKCGALSPNFAQLVNTANAKNGNGSERILSPRTLNQWVLDYHKAQNTEQRLQRLAPAQRRAKMPEELVWLPEFLAVYRNTNGVCIAEAYAEFAQRWQAAFADQPTRLALLPSLSTVRRGLAKMPRLLKEIGRKTGAELRALNTYVKRDWSVLKANDVWVGDGHSMKMKVKHPDHGRPFIPELTLVMDAASRFIVGWSISLAENCIAVADAIRHGVENHGIPAIYYSDNGGGEKNWVLDGDITGMLPRLGINHQTGIPGNPQGRGIIERANQTILLRIARQFQTYHGTGADRETVRKTQTAVISLDKALRKGATALTEKQRWAIGKLPSWQELIAAVEVGINWYNNQHIHREIGTTPARKRTELLKGAEIHHITPIESRDLFRPQVTRIAQRGWISLFTNDYFHQSLINVNGEKVAVSFDIHNAQSVIVRKLDGTFLCEAQWNGNKHAAFPMPFIEQKRKERHQRRLKLKEEQVAEINAELNPTLTIEHSEGAELLRGMRIKAQAYEQIDEDEWEIFQADLNRKLKKAG